MVTARRWKLFHRYMCGVWALLLIPTLLWWSQSILWVGFMSLYANIGAHWGAAQAAEADEHASQ